MRPPETCRRVSREHYGGPNPRTARTPLERSIPHHADAAPEHPSSFQATRLSDQLRDSRMTRRELLIACEAPPLQTSIPLRCGQENRVDGMTESIEGEQAS